MQYNRQHWESNDSAPRKYKGRLKDKYCTVKDIAIGVDMIPST
jgi:hypothetical protein